MSLDFKFSLEELEAAEAATANPYLRDSARGLQLLARLIGHPAPEAVQEAQRVQLARLHTLIHQDFIALTARGSYPGEAQALRQLLALEDALENLALFPDLASKSVVGVGGGFSAGKSRFLNTLLGVDLLPESLEPTTAIPSFITRGAADIVALNSFNHRIALDREALQAITHAFNDHYRDSLGEGFGEGFGFAHILKLLMLHQPRLPWDNLAFLDTPGYSKADAEGAAETDQGIALRQLTEADHVLWLLSAKNGSIRQDDLDFLRRLNHPQPIFFVVTQADLVGEARIGAIMDSTRTAIEQAGIPCAGLLAWAAPLGSEHGERIAGDDVRVWLDQLDSQPKYTQHRRTCEQVLDGYIRHNQDSLAGSRKKLALLNTLLPLADQLPESERSTLQELIREQRQSQGVFKEQVERFTVLKNEIFEVVGAIIGEMAVDALSSEELFQKALHYNEQEQYELAATYFTHAAEQGHVAAQFNLGLCYELGLGVTSSAEQAVTWYSKAAEKGDADAQFFLGLCHYFGYGVEENEEAAVPWFRKSADQGNADAQLYLGKCYYFGHGLPENERAAALWFHKAAEQGHADAQFDLGRCYYFARGLPESKESAALWFRKAAEQNHADAQYYLGECYYFGHGLPEDEEIAAHWYQKSADQGHPEGQFHLGKCYYYGEGLPLSKSNAASWFLKAADQGHADAQYYLALFHYLGLGVADDKSLAVILFRKAAEQGHADAMFRIGECYYHGRGVPANMAIGLEWIRKAAALGSIDAQNRLGHA